MTGVPSGFPPTSLERYAENAPPRARQRLGRHATEYALAAGATDEVKELLKFVKLSADWRGLGGRTFFAAAAEGGLTSFMSGLLSNGERADLNAVSGEDEATPLMLACKGGHVSTAKYLLTEGANVDVADKNGRTVLHYAMECGQPDVPNLLMITRGDLNAKDKQGRTPALLAMRSPIMCDIFRALVRRGVDVDAVDNKGWTLAHEAVANRQMANLESLLKAGVKPDHRDVRGNSPLLVVADRHKDATYVKKLANMSTVDTNAINTRRDSAILLAVKKKKTAIVRALAARGANLSLAYPLAGKEVTLLYFGRNSLSVTQVLLDKGAPFNRRQRQLHGFNAAHFTAEDGSADVLKAVIDNGVDVEALSGVFDVGGRKVARSPPFIVAAIYANWSCIEVLAEDGRVDINVRNDVGMTAIGAVCWTATHHTLQDEVQTLNQLLRLGADEKITDDDGDRPTDLISKKEDPDGILKKVLQNAPKDKVWWRRMLPLLLRFRAGKAKAATKTAHEAAIMASRAAEEAEDAQMAAETAAALKALAEGGAAAADVAAAEYVEADATMATKVALANKAAEEAAAAKMAAAKAVAAAAVAVGDTGGRSVHGSKARRIEAAKKELATAVVFLTGSNEDVFRHVVSFL